MYHALMLMHGSLFLAIFRPLLVSVKCSSQRFSFHVSAHKHQDQARSAH